MILNRGTCEPVAFVGPAEDEQAQADGEFLAAAREDVPALLAELAAADQTNEDAVSLCEQLTAENNSMNVEIQRLRRVLDTRDAEYALVVRVPDDGRAQVDARPGVSTEQAARWLQELADGTARRADGGQARADQSVPLTDVLALIAAVRDSIDMPADVPADQVNARVWRTVGVLSAVGSTVGAVTAAQQVLSAETRPTTPA
jgi:hypothetical protein